MNLIIILMWLFFPIATIAVLAFVEAAFYGFCWCFGKLDNYFQDRYWENKKNSIRKNYKVQ